MVTTFLEQVIRGYGQTERRILNTTGRHWRGPICLTAKQARQIHTEAGLTPAEEFDALLAAGLPDVQMLGVPLQLVATQTESTPYLEGWI